MPNVLIVDDNGKNRKLARDLLRSDGLGTIEAASGAEGIALATAHTPDLILMDLRLPDMGGEEATRRLGDAALTEQIPVVAMSALPLDGMGDWIEEAGFAGWIGKPIEVAGFTGQVRRFLPGPDR